MGAGTRMTGNDAVNSASLDANPLAARTAKPAAAGPLGATPLANHWKQSRLCGSATRHRDRAKCFVSPMRFGSGSR
jgi:hypothetical protein